jgi:ribosomal protein S12 methylthiotransferase
VDGALANQLPDHVDPAEQEDRLARLMYLQEEISAEKLATKVGKTLTVLVDDIDEQGAVARSAADAPEIDGLVYIDGAQHLEIGEFVTVKIIDSDEHDLWGELAV